MKYIVLSTSVTDELHFADGACLPQVAGGAGIYALAGMRIWCDDVGIVTGVGEDYFDRYGDWYRRNGITTQGLIVKDAHTPHNIIQYFADGERTETPKYGLEHYQKMEGTVRELQRYSAGAKGVYVFKNSSQPFWEELLALKKRQGFQLMWEIAADAAWPENRPAVERIAKKAEALSINRTEAMRLFAASTEEEAVSSLLAWKLPMVYFRVGGKGAYVLAGGKATLVPSVQGCQVQDVTGGGNSSSGGAFLGFCETGDAVRAGRMGNISASFCIAQYGVPLVMDQALRAKAQRLLAEMEGTSSEK